DNNGNLSAAYRVPSVPNGSYDLLARGQSSGISLFVPFTVAGVVAPPAPSPTATPASTAPAATAAPPATPTLPPASAPTTTYFADGYTGTAATNGKATFAVHLVLYNPGLTT